MGAPHPTVSGGSETQSFEKERGGEQTSAMKRTQKNESRDCDETRGAAIDALLINAAAACPCHVLGIISSAITTIDRLFFLFFFFEQENYPRRHDEWAEAQQKAARKYTKGC